VIALEILDLLGIDPKIMLMAGLDGIEFTQMMGNLPPSDTLNCRDLYKQDWPQIPFIGFLSDPHHNPCYRAWILHQEIKAHHYIQFLGPLKALSQDKEWLEEVETLLEAIKY
jgi:hypothetical protein